MTAFNRSTCRRLHQLPQPLSIWEGDRRSLAPNLSAGMMATEIETDIQGDCILWVDGTNGIVRAIDVVPLEAGHEAVVRTLLRAIEHPQSGGDAVRPKKIVVRDREIQFFLRGALQDLEIAVEYAPELPLIDEIFRGLQEFAGNQCPKLPAAHAEPLMEQADVIWEDAPWHYLNEQQIIAVKLNRWDIETVYVSVLGMAGVEYGILLYHSLDSLKQFRERVTRIEQSSKQLQQAFLEQDCLFLTFDQIEDDVPEVGEFQEHTYRALDWANFMPMRVEPSFGSLHPLEGLRTTLSEEEAMAMRVALAALHRFFRQHHHHLEQGFPDRASRYRIPYPGPKGETALPERVPNFDQGPAAAKATGVAEAKDSDPSDLPIAVSVKTLPDLVSELDAITQIDGDETSSLPGNFPVVRDDLVPDNSLISLSILTTELIETLREMRQRYHQPSVVDWVSSTADFPVVMIQTSQPKAKTLVQAIQDGGGATALCFNSSRDPFSREEYDIGLFQTGDGIFHLFSEYEKKDQSYVRRRQRWDRACKTNQAHCGIIIARGLTGANRGNPQLRDMVALFEVPVRTPEDLGLMTVSLPFELDWF